MNGADDVAALVEMAEDSARANTGLPWDSHDGLQALRLPVQLEAKEAMRSTAATPLPAETAPQAVAGRGRCYRGRGDAYAHDGSLEGMLTAIHAAMVARDAGADIYEECQLQPRLGQHVFPVRTRIDDALKVRRLMEYALGAQAFHCVRTAGCSADPERGNIVYRFLLDALRESGRDGCTRCPRKRTCRRACDVPPRSAQLDDLANPRVFALMALYRSVVNERHLMQQFMRFEHCAGDVWFARCNPKASVVPLLMDWFIPRFNDQRFVIYDENHAISGVYDGNGWYLVGGDAVTPPPHMEDEGLMREAWRRFYRSVSVEARYHPELRRGFMPMRLWRNLPEMQPPRPDPPDCAVGGAGPEAGRHQRGTTPRPSHRGMNDSPTASPSCQK